MSWESRLSEMTKDALQKLARNASRLASQADTPKGREAEALLGLIETERARRALPGNIEAFMEAFPLGFGDPLYIKEERKDKWDAHAFCAAELTPAAFEAARTEPAPLMQAVKRLVSMTNLIQGSFEKPQLLDAIQDPKNTHLFLTELANLLHGEACSAERLEHFSDYLHELGLRKWTYSTYFLFMSNPKQEIFVKPEGLKKAVDIADFPLEYDPAPTARVYRQVLAFAAWIDVHLRQHGLAPQDNIDTQSFIWRMAPTGKFAR